MDELILKLEELGISQEEMEEVKKTLETYSSDVSEVAVKKIDTANIKAMILNEPDWRKRASLAALLISKEL